METAGVRFECDINSPRRARELVRRPPAAAERPELTDVASLLVSELVTNAVVHPRTPVVVRLEISGRPEVRIEVTDQLAIRPVVSRAGGFWEEGGRGLALVAALATRWGCERGLDDDGHEKLPVGGHETARRWP